MASFLCSISAIFLLPLVTAYGQSKITNSCPFPVNLWVVSSSQGPMITLPSGGDYSHEFEINPAGGGISLKLTNEPFITDPITQFEYTLAGSEIYYDISNVNGSPFKPYGLTLAPSDPSCMGAMCTPNSDCEGMIYNQPNDNFATQACGSGADLTLTLCDGGNAVASPVAASAVAAPTSAPMPIAAPAPSTPIVPAVTTIPTPVPAPTAATPCDDTTMPAPPAPTTFLTMARSTPAAQAPPVTSAYPNVYQPVAPGVSIATAYVTDIQTFTDVLSEVVTTTVM